nr:carboxypeptidase regulatory-like domain-containing protein [Calothrix sp. MO_167.B42]
MQDSLSHKRQKNYNKSFYIFYLFLAIIYPIIINPAQANTRVISSLETTIKTESSKNIGEFSTFPVGLSVGKRNVIPSILIRGKEDGLQAIDFDNWLLPYDTVIKVLKLKVTNLPDGQLEMRSPG